MADLVDCPKCGINLPLAAAACPKCGLIFDRWHGLPGGGTAAATSLPPPPPTPRTVTYPGSRSADDPASGNGGRLNLRMVALALAVCVALFVAGRWSVSSSRPTIVRPAATPSPASPAGVPAPEVKNAAPADVQPTGEIKADIASIDAEIRRLDEEDAKYSGGLVKALIGSELHIYRQTRAMLQQRARSWLFGIGLSFTVDGKPFVLPATAPEQLAAVEREVTETRAKVADTEAEAARYSGGLVQAMSLANAATVRNTLAMLEQHRLALKYSLPQYIGFQRDDTSASPRSTAFTPPTQVPVSVEPFVVRGGGQEASRLFDLEATLYVFKLEYVGESNFIVDLMDENGKRIENLTNVVGNFNGSRAVRIARRGKYLLNVEHASGPWSATIGPPESR